MNLDLYLPALRKAPLQPFRRMGDAPITARGPAGGYNPPPGYAVAGFQPDCPGGVTSYCLSTSGTYTLVPRPVAPAPPPPPAKQIQTTVQSTNVQTTPIVNVTPNIVIGSTLGTGINSGGGGASAPLQAPQSYVGPSQDAGITPDQYAALQQQYLLEQQQLAAAQQAANQPPPAPTVTVIPGGGTDVTNTPAVTPVNVTPVASPSQSDGYNWVPVAAAAAGLFLILSGGQSKNPRRRRVYGMRRV